MEPVLSPEPTQWPAPKDAERLRRIFLQDHQAAVHGALSLVDRAIKENRAHRVATFLGTIRASLRDDREQLQLVFRALRIRPSLVKNTAARAAERTARLKANGRVRSYSPLSRVEELEGLLMLTAQRAAMWRVLERHALIEPRLTVVDARGRARLAEAELQLLERELVLCSAEAF